ncbi:hypothetical protein BC332_31778 [Capsicum chinense]|nr:hypothetical protein BC332_31778 [Capsicum chinense]
MGETMVPCIDDLHSLFLDTLNDDTLDLHVRIMDTIAAIRFIQCLSSSNETEKFQDLLPEDEKLKEEMRHLVVELARKRLVRVVSLV